MPAVYYSPSSTTANTDTGVGTTRALAYNDLAAAITAATASAPCVIYVDSATNLSSSIDITIAGGQTLATKLTLISIDFTTTNNPPIASDYKPGAVIGTAASKSFSAQGAVKLVGVTLLPGAGTNAVSSFSMSGSGSILDVEFGADAYLYMNSTSTSSLINFNVNNTWPIHVKLSDVPGVAPASRIGKIKFATTSMTFTVNGGRWEFRNMKLLRGGSAIPVNVFTLPVVKSMTMDFEDVDCSGLDATSALLNVTFIGHVVLARFVDCLIPSAVTICRQAAATLATGSRISLVRCSAVSGGRSNSVIASEGTQSEDATVTLVGGATDNVTPRSWHYLATANATLSVPYESQPILISNDQVGSAITASIEGLSAAGTLPTNAQVWFDVETLTDSASTLGTYASNGLANDLATPVAHAASSATWNNAPTGSTKFKMTAIITPQQKGLLRIIPRVASGEYYLDPKPIVQGGPAVGRSIVTASGAMMNETQGTTPGATVTQYLMMGQRRRA